jgi:hypothetical protein
MTMTARLTRGDGPRQWQSYRSSDTSPCLVFYRCPFCTLINTLHGSHITADGLVAQAVTCPTPLCGMSYALYLEGWGLGSQTAPHAFALCQADRYGN